MTLRFLAVSAVTTLILSLAVPAMANQEAMKKCLASVKTVKEMRAESDSGEKELAMVDKLIGVSEGLCKDEATEDAAELLAVARGIMGTEEGAGTDKDQ